MSGKDVGSKTGGGALKWFAAVALILLFILGGLSLLALSAFLLLKPAGAEKKATDNPGPACSPKEIPSGASCCADSNGNGVCDIREDAVTLPAVSETQYLQPTTTTQKLGPAQTAVSTITLLSILPTFASTTTTNPSTTSATITSTLGRTAEPTTSTTITTLPTGSMVSSCADKYGVSSDTVIYVYTLKCCEKTVSPLIEQASKAKGYKYKYVAANALDKSSEGLLKCYLPPGYITVPQLICPANGSTMILTSQGTFDQIITFTQKCLEAAYS